MSILLPVNSSTPDATPSGVLVRDVLGRASALLNDTAPQFHRFTQSDLVSFLNEAQIVLCKFLPAAFSRIDAIRLKPGTRQSVAWVGVEDCKPGDGSTLDTNLLGNQFLRAIRNMGTDGLKPGTAIRPMDQKVLDCDPSWHTREGKSVSGYVYDPATPRNFYVVPAVPSSGLWIEIAWTVLPTPIPEGVDGQYAASGPDETEVKVPGEHMDDLVNYIVARANMMDQEWANPAKAAAFTSLFLASLNAKVQVLTGTNPNFKRLPFAAEPIGRAS